MRMGVLALKENLILHSPACARGELTAELRALLPINMISEALISQFTWANFVLYGKPHKLLI
jgi:hypothetical protein